MSTVLAKTYPGTGRPSSFRVIRDDDEEEIRRLMEGHGYICAEANSSIGSEDQAWERLTYKDSDGFTQWRPEKSKG